MANQNESHFSMDDLMNASFWDAHKNRLIGLGVIAAIVVVAVLFFREQGQNKQAGAWEAMVDDKGALLPNPDASGSIASSDAEPWALWQSARSAWAEKDFAEAKGFISDLQDRFPGHPATAKASAFAEDVQTQLSWMTEHPETDSLPDVPATQTISLDTGLGNIEIGLYVDEAPLACAEFLKLVREGGALASASFIDGQPDQYIVLGAPDPEEEEGEGDNADDTDGSADQPEDDETDEEEAEPSDLAKGIVPDQNNLSHFEGAVSFRRQFTTEADATPQLSVFVADAPNEDRRQVVIGKVTSGLELLKEAAKREKSDTGTRFREPVEVKSFAEGDALKSIK